MAPGHLGRPSGRSVASPPRYRSGILRFAFSATSALWFARMPLSGPRFMTRGRSQTDPPHSRPSHIERRSPRPDSTPSRWRRRTAPAAACASTCVRQRTVIDMAPKAPLLEQERANYDFFLNLPELQRAEVKRLDHKTSQFLEPLFEYSGACAGCGETPYLK